MKKSLLTLLTIGSLSFNLLAQTNTTTINTNVPTALDQFKSGTLTGYDYLKKLSFKDGLAAEPFALYHKGNFGGGLAVSTIHTNSVNFGFALAAVDETKETGKKGLTFYDTTLSIAYNGSTYVPVIGSLDYYAETGAAVDLSNPINGIYSQSAGGIKKVIPLNETVSFIAGGGVGYLTKWNGPFYLMHVGIATKLNGKGFLGLW